MPAPALERGDPNLGRLEVDVAGTQRQRLAHPAPGHRKGPGERLHGGLGMSANRDEEALAPLGREVLPPAGVDQGDFRRRGQSEGLRGGLRRNVTLLAWN